MSSTVGCLNRNRNVVAKNDDRAGDVKLLNNRLTSIRWGLQMLLESLLTAKIPITLGVFEDVCWGVQMLL